MTTVNVNEDKYSVTVTEGATTVVTVKAPGPQGPGFPDGDLGDVTSSNTGANVVVNSGAITNAKVNDSAAIAGTKISPDFGSQNITTTGNAVFGGNLTVSGTTTTINTQTLDVEDINVTLGKVGSPTDITANNGGISLLGDTTKTFQWLNATDSWTSSENLSLPDNKKLQLGDSQDLKIFHDGSHSIIAENGTGNLLLCGTRVNLFNSARNETLISAQENGPVQLFFDNVKKAETTATGFNINGTCVTLGATHSGDVTFTGDSANIVFDKSDSALEFADNAELRLGSVGEVRIFHTGSSTHFLVSQHFFNLQANGYFFYNQAGNETLFSLEQNGAVKLYFDNVKKAETSATGFNVEGTVTCDDILLANSIQHEGQTNTKIEFDSTIIKFDSNGVTRLQVHPSALFVASGYKTTFLAVSGESPFIRSFGSTNGVVVNGDLQIGSGTDSMAMFKRDGAVELFFNGAKRCETTNNGATVSGDFVVARDGNATINIQDTGHGFPASTIGLSNGGRDFNITAPKDIRLFPQNNENGIVIEANGQVELYFNNLKKAETSLTGLDVTGAVKASTGILFGSDTADANTLDDYEEGTWTPTVVSEGTIGTPQYTCTYTKIGRLVTINADIHQLSDTTSSTFIRIGGLPYVPSSTNGNWSAVCHGERYGGADIIVAFLQYLNGSWAVSFRFGVPSGHYSNVSHSNISDTGTDNNLRFTLTYEIT